MCKIKVIYLNWGYCGGFCIKFSYTDTKLYVAMPVNREIFNMQGKQRLTTGAFFCYVGQITNRDVMSIFLVDDRFLGNVIDVNKVYMSRLDIKYKRKKAFKKKYGCPITNRFRSRMSFFGGISRFQFKEMVCEGEYLIGISRFG